MLTQHFEFDIQPQAPTPARAPRYPIFHAVDTDGTEVVKVMMKRGTFCTLYASSYEMIKTLYVSMTFQINDNGNGCAYIRTNNRRGGHYSQYEQVARLILGSPKGKIVRYIDGDRTNLRLNNLQVETPTKILVNRAALKLNAEQSF